MDLDCSQFPGRLREICEGTAQKSNGQFFTLRERQSILSQRLELTLGKADLSLLKESVSTRSSSPSRIGDILKEIIKRETGSDISCGECKKEVDRLNLMTSAEVEKDLDELAGRILERSKNHAQHWYQRLASRILPDYVKTEIRKWIREACDINGRDQNNRIVTMIWEYGVTTVPIRKLELLPRTLKSLAEAGFDKPRLFVDGSDNPNDYKEFELLVTVRYPKVRTAANWLLSMWELYTRNPVAERYAIFQDDIICVKNLKKFLEISKYPDEAYLNLHTAPSNQDFAVKEKVTQGWYVSNQLGKGALALVFSNEALRGLLAHQYFVDRFQSVDRGHRAVDGGIVETMKRVGKGWKEYVHTPCLVQHTGEISSMGNPKIAISTSFPGESFDALNLLVKS